MTKYCSESMSGKSLRKACMSLAASSAGAVFLMKGSFRVNLAVSISWQQCFTNDGVLYDLVRYYVGGDIKAEKTG